MPTLLREKTSTIDMDMAKREKLGAVAALGPWSMQST
jgi:hypothetical protein